MSEAPEIEWKLHIRDDRKIIELLVRELYGDDPMVSLREVLQNAHDACIALRDAGGGGRTSKAGVDVQLGSDTDGEYIAVRDYGIGMTPDEIYSRLLAIGESGKSDWQDARDLEQLREIVSKRKDTIGKFGIGFLASFILARHVRLRTWRYTGGRGGLPEGVELICRLSEVTPPRPIEAAESGTEVRLYFRTTSHNEQFNNRLRELKRPDTLERYISKLFYFSREPIRHIGVREPKLLSMEAQDVDQIEPEDLNRHLFGVDQGRPFAAHRAEFFLHERGARGHLFLYLWKRTSNNETQGQANIWVRGMLVEGASSDLLPSWATCFTALVHCEDLPVELDRRGVVRTSVEYGRLRETAQEHCLQMFQKAAQSDAKTFRREVWDYVHGMVLPQALRAAGGEAFYSDPFHKRSAEAFIERVGPYLPLRALQYNPRTGGWFTLYIQLEQIALNLQSAKVPPPYTIPYLTTEGTIDTALDPTLLGSEYVIDARNKGDRGRRDGTSIAFLHKVSERCKERFKLEEAKPQVGNELTDEEMKQQGWSALQREIESHARYRLGEGTETYAVRVRRFKPTALPMVAAQYDLGDEKGELFYQNFEKLLEAFPTFREVFGDYNKRANESRSFLMVNADNPVMKEIARLYTRSDMAAVVADATFVHLLRSQIDDARIDFFGGSAIGIDAQLHIYENVRQPIALELLKSLTERHSAAILPLTDVPDVPQPYDAFAFSATFRGHLNWLTTAPQEAVAWSARLGAALAEIARQRRWFFPGMKLDGFTIAIEGAKTSSIGHQMQELLSVLVNATNAASTPPQIHLAGSWGSVYWGRFGRAGGLSGHPVARCQLMLKLPMDIWQSSSLGVLLDGNTLNAVATRAQQAQFQQVAIPDGPNTALFSGTLYRYR